MIEICEIFYSLQGESSYCGQPCIFIRLSGCNLRCSYCDTQYSYAPGRMVEIRTILEEISAFPARLVEITGGEPLWQEESIGLMEALLEQDYTVLLETNGSLWLGDVPAPVIKIVDIKTPGSGHGDSFMKWNLKQLSGHDELKFVLTNYQDYGFALDFIRTNNLEGRIIHFSPVTSVLNPETLSTWMLNDAAPARLSLQLHKILNLR
ncbi:MAG TPA: radical SAM protein [Candidatus Cloacimonadota bacterium]|nr:radical SAM protein [Candidatus Cloacimonadota bacterium]